MVRSGKINGRKLVTMKNNNGDLKWVYNGKEGGGVRIVTHEDDGVDLNSVI